MDFVYVCFEENQHGLLASETGGTKELKIIGSDKKEAAIAWIRERLENAIKNNFVIDAEADVERILEGDNHISIILFHTYQENWDYSYSIVVEKKPVD